MLATKPTMITQSLNKNSNSHSCCCYYLKILRNIQEVCNMITQTISYIDLVDLGFPKATAQQIIRQTKLNLVKQGYTLYSNRRLGTVPVSAVEEILGFKLHD